MLTEATFDTLYYHMKCIIVTYCICYCIPSGKLMLLSLHTTKFNIYIVCTNKDINILKELKRGSKL